MSADDIFADNPLCRLLAIRYPICQAGMYQVAYSSLAAAVSNAGIEQAGDVIESIAREAANVLSRLVRLAQ
jgi:NAD(P)H-dependent flavin oxidoreductase YrpB (nitropropane dioxygenase family)